MARMKRFLYVVLAGGVFVGALSVTLFLASSFLNGSRQAAAPSGPTKNYLTGTLTAASTDSITIKTSGIGGHEETLANGDQTVSVEHLQQHVQYGWPVVVYWKTENGRKTAVQIADN